jgi:hypothetical protein
MIIGYSKIGIGRIGIRDDASLLELLTNASILERRLTSMYSNATLVEVLLAYIESNADIDAYNHREVLTNGTIIGVEIPELLTSANIAVLMAASVLSNANITITQLVNMLTGASIIGPKDVSMLTGASILDYYYVQVLSTANLADLIPVELTTGAYLSEYITPEMATNAYIASFRASTISTNAYIVDSRYWAIGPEDATMNISGMVADPDPKGFGIKASHQQIPGARRTIIQDKGLDGGEYSFSVYFGNDSIRQAFQLKANNDAEDLQLFAGRSDRFYWVKKVSLEPLKDKRYAGPAAKITCLMEDPYLYHAIDQGLDLGACPLPQNSTSCFNYGTAEAPFLFKIGGFYASGHLTLPYVKCFDGATEETSIYLGPGLLSAEYAELTREGAEKYLLAHTYADDYSTNNYWQYDAVQSGCSLSGGQVSVPAGAWFYYKFQGYPLKDDIQLEATITTATSPIIQYSTDGITWSTAIAASEIVIGKKKIYYLSGTEKKSTVYIRFYSPVGSSMTIQDVSFTMERDISAQADQIPQVPVGEARTLQITGSGSTKAKITTTFRSRWHAQ